MAHKETHFPPPPKGNFPDEDRLLQWLSQQTISVQKLIGGEIQAVDITLGSGGTIESSNFTADSAGWQIDGDGNAEFNDVVIRGDIEADDWDGASPANLNSRDGAATQGFYMDTSAGAAQFEGNMWIGGALTVDGATSLGSTLTLSTNGKIRSASSGQRIVLSNADVDRLLFYTGDADELEPGLIRSNILGTDDTTKQFTLSVWAPRFSADGDDGTVLSIRSPSEDDSSLPAQIVATYQGTTTPTPEFKITNGMKLLIEDGSVSSPSLTFNFATTSGIYRPGGNQVAIAAGGSQSANFTASRNFMVAAAADTTGSGANARINSTDGRLQRSTSSLKYKPDWRWARDAADLMLPTPIRWTDERGQLRLGFGAEHIHKAVPEAYEEEIYDLRSLVAILSEKIKRLEAARWRNRVRELPAKLSRLLGRPRPRTGT